MATADNFFHLTSHFDGLAFVNRNHTPFGVVILPTSAGFEVFVRGQLQGTAADEAAAVAIGVELLNRNTVRTPMLRGKGTANPLNVTKRFFS